jgi:hypothetical protein
MGVEQKISNDAKVTFLNAFYHLMTLYAWPGRLGLIPKKATFMVAEQIISKNLKSKIQIQIARSFIK